jgi:homoaconitase/3-isopropylmalate dehydratase large subunit
MCIDEFEAESQGSSPDHVDIVHSLVELTSLKIDQAFIGSCAISTKTLPSSVSFTS